MKTEHYGTATGSCFFDTKKFKTEKRKMWISIDGVKKEMELTDEELMRLQHGDAFVDSISSLHDDELFIPPPKPEEMGMGTASYMPQTGWVRTNNVTSKKPYWEEEGFTKSNDKPKYHNTNVSFEDVFDEHETWMKALTYAFLFVAVIGLILLLL